MCPSLGLGAQETCHHSTFQEQKFVPEPAAPEVPHGAGETFCADCLDGEAGWWTKGWSLSRGRNGFPGPLTELSATKMTGDTHHLQFVAAGKGSQHPTVKSDPSETNILQGSNKKQSLWALEVFISRV